MKIVTAPRASTLIYGLAKGGCDGVWLIPANVCPAIPLALSEAKIHFEFIDISSITLCLDLELTKKRLLDEKQPSVTGVIYVRTYGFSPTAKQDLTRLKLSMKHDAVLIDDQCLCEPIVTEKNLQSYGADVAIFSTGYSKVIDLGTGGYGIFFSDVKYSPPNTVRSPNRFNGIMKEYKVAMAQDYPLFASSKSLEALPRWVPGGEGQQWKNLKAKIIAKYPKIRAHKEQINAVYSEELKNFNPLNDNYQNWRFNVRIKNSQEVLEGLFKAKLFASNHYYPSSMLWGSYSAPNSLALQKSIINLFNDENFSIKKAEQAVEIVKRIAKRENK